MPSPPRAAVRSRPEIRPVPKSYPRPHSRGVRRSRLLQSPARPDRCQRTSQANRGSPPRGKTGGRLYLDPRLLGLGPRPRTILSGSPAHGEFRPRARLGCPAIGTKPPTDINGSAAIGDRRRTRRRPASRPPRPSISPHRRKASNRAPARLPPRPTISGSPATGIGSTDDTYGGQATGAAASRIGSGFPPDTSGPPAATFSLPGIGITPWRNAAWSSARSTYANPYYVAPTYYYTPERLHPNPGFDGLFVLPSGLWPLLFRRLLRSGVRAGGHLSVVCGPRAPLRLRAAVRLRSLVLRAARPGLGDRACTATTNTGLHTLTPGRPTPTRPPCGSTSECGGVRFTLAAPIGRVAARRRGDAVRTHQRRTARAVRPGDSTKSDRSKRIAGTTEFRAHAQARANGGQPVRMNVRTSAVDHLAAGDQCRRPPGGHDCRPDRRFQRIRAADATTAKSRTTANSKKKDPRDR